jgi:hypothetical protein
MEQMRPAGVPLHERGDEAGMDAHIAEVSAATQHSGGLGEGGRWAVEVGVGQQRGDRVEGAVGERQGGGIGRDQRGAGRTGSLSGEAELVAGQSTPTTRQPRPSSSGMATPVPQPRSRQTPGPGPTSRPSASIAVVVPCSPPISRSYHRPGRHRAVDWSWPQDSQVDE